MIRIPRRARRLQRSNERARRHPSLNLVALMDVFTILVFFFLVHSSDMEIDASNIVRLPESVADQKPRDTVVITITPGNILVQNEEVAGVDSVLQSGNPVIPALSAALQARPGGMDSSSGDQGDAGKEITILGDKEISFKLLRKVMLTCTRSGYSRISLSVLQRSDRPG